MPTLALSALALPLLGTGSALATLYTAFGYQMRNAAPISVLNFLNMAEQMGFLSKHVLSEPAGWALIGITLGSRHLRHCLRGKRAPSPKMNRMWVPFILVTGTPKTSY
jgi:hypothetical protein